MGTRMNDADEEYRRTQSEIYGLQETLLNSTRIANATKASSRHSATKKINQHKKHNSLKKHNENVVVSDSDIVVDSKPTLQFVFEKYGGGPDKHANMETLVYHPYKEGCPNKTNPPMDVPFPYNTFELAMPRPFLPAYGSNMINRLVTVCVSYEDLKNSVDQISSPRAVNNEVWGCQIYTDDSDPVLVLRHCGISIDENNGSCRTPANLNNQEDITGTIPPKGTPFDLEVDLLLLPTLQQYESIYQHGVRSRFWGGENDSAHDGLSYGIYSIRITSRDTSTQNINTDEHQITPSSHWKS